MAEMSLETAVRSRHSVRGFLPDRVPQATLDRVFDLARWAPSGTNIQPWQVYVASGETRDNLRAQFMQRTRDKHPPSVDHKGTRGPLGEIWKDRRRECAAVLYDAMDVAWEDKPARAEVAFRNFELFDAPHVAFLCMNEVFDMGSAWDIGMYAQTLMLAMTANGLASCAQGTMAHHPDLVREAFGLDDEVKVLFGISFGFPNPTMAVNTALTTRAELQETVTFKG
jgi:nitroreductase